MKYNKLAKFLYKKRFLFIILSSIIIISLLFFNLFKMVFFLLILLALIIASSTVARQIPRYNTSIELIMFGTVLCGFAYGMKIGALFGLIGSIIYYFGAGRMSYYVIVFAPLYSIIGIIAGFLAKTTNNNDIFMLGMILTISYSIISSLLVYIIFNAKFDKAFGFILINTIFNFIMFKYFGPMFLALMIV
ncbi:MAG: ECF transporter S component [Candidatus Woesearchaeota archaeon]